MKRGVTSLLLAHYSSVIIFVCCYVTSDLVGPESGTLCHVCIINVFLFLAAFHFKFRQVHISYCKSNVLDCASSHVIVALKMSALILEGFAHVQSLRLDIYIQVVSAVISPIQ